MAICQGKIIWSLIHWVVIYLVGNEFHTYKKWQKQHFCSAYLFVIMYIILTEWELKVTRFKIADIYHMGNVFYGTGTWKNKINCGLTRTWSNTWYNLLNVHWNCAPSPAFDMIVSNVSSPGSFSVTSLNCHFLISTKLFL